MLILSGAVPPTLGRGELLSFKALIEGRLKTVTRQHSSLNGMLVDFGATEAMFMPPADPCIEDCNTGRFG